MIMDPDQTGEQPKHEHREHHGHNEHKVSPVKQESTSSSNSEGKHKFLVGAAVVQVILLLYIAFQVAGGGVAGVGLEGGAVVDPGYGEADVPSAPIDMESLMDDDAIKGDPNAPVTIVEWSDFECPFCARFYSDTLSLIDEKYIQTGKVKLVYRDFPLSFHPNAQKSAEAAECAGEQGKYYEMHDLLFERGVAGGVTSYKQFAQQLGLNTAEFNTCLDSGAMASEVQKDFADGQRAGVQGTPGFIVNGQLISGAQPFPVFEQVIEAALRG